MKFTIEEVHISQIKQGDTVEHNGEITTVCKHNIKESDFMGISLFGDSYKSGYKKVKKLIIFKA